LPKLIIDGKEIIAEDGATILEAALQNGIDIPYFCYHKDIGFKGSCRICLVEIEKNPKLQISCSTKVSEGMKVYTNSEKVKNAREAVMEFLLINHPLDCPVCDKAGECMLQDYSFQYGKGYSRFHEVKKRPPYKDLGETIFLHTTRCILCNRCMRFLRDVVGTGEILVLNRGSKAQIATFPGRPLNNLMSGNLADICPVGALVSKEFLHTTRVWNLKQTESICNRCSAGCNIILEQMENRIYRIRPRENEDVNKSWMCDLGRYRVTEFDKMKRINFPLKRGMDTEVEIKWDDTYKKISDSIKAIKADEIALLISPFASNEDLFTANHLFKDTVKSNNIHTYIRQKEEDAHFKSGFTIEGERYPNVQGVKIILGDNLKSFTELKDSLSNGKIKLLFIYEGEEPEEFSDEHIELFAKVENLFVFASQVSTLTDKAALLLPVTLFTEKTGTFVNSKGRVQRFFDSLIPQFTAKNLWEIFAGISEKLDNPVNAVEASDIFNLIGGKIQKFKDLKFSKTGKTGVEI
jgi:NADH-quinone oxidoreductase subunit G